MHVLRYLKKKTLEDLVNEFNIRAKTHPKYPELVHLSYDATRSPLHRAIVQECRGLILKFDPVDGYSIVGRGFDKFLNINEGAGDDLDWSTAQAYEKLDGTFILMYWYDNQWQVATKGTAAAEGMCFAQISFHDLFWKTFKELGYNLPPDSMSPFCFMFELMTPDNRVVIQHTEARLVLTGARFISPHMTMEYDPYSMASLGEGWFNWELPEVIFPPATITPKSVIELVNTKKGDVFEGVILVDHTFTRVKVKNSFYLSLHFSLTDLTMARALHIVVSNEVSEINSYTSNYIELFQDIAEAILAIKKDGLAVLKQVEHVSSKKDRNFWLRDNYKKIPNYKYLEPIIKALIFEGRSPDEAFLLYYNYRPNDTKDLVLKKLHDLGKIDKTAFQSLLSIHEKDPNRL